MERKSHISESELMDFFNDSLSVEEKQVILDWKELSEENRRLFEKVRKENLLLKEVVRAKLQGGGNSGSGGDCRDAVCWSVVASYC